MKMNTIPSELRTLTKERKFRKAIIRASKFESIEVMARWDKGNAWDGYRKTRTGWKHIQNGMHSQMPVPISVMGRNLKHVAENTWIDTSFEVQEAAWKSFWNWDNGEELI
jgi:hypothetical protein